MRPRWFNVWTETPKGQVYAQWTLVDPPKLRTVVVHGPWHRCDGYTNETYVDSDKHFAKLESGVAYEAFMGPWLGNANYAIAKGASASFHARMTRESDLRLALSAHLRLPRR